MNPTEPKLTGLAALKALASPKAPTQAEVDQADRTVLHWLPESLRLPGKPIREGLRGRLALRYVDTANTGFHPEAIDMLLRLWIRDLMPDGTTPEMVEAEVARVVRVAATIPRNLMPEEGTKALLAGLAADQAEEARESMRREAREKAQASEGKLQFALAVDRHYQAAAEAKVTAAHRAAVVEVLRMADEMQESADALELATKHHQAGVCELRRLAMELLASHDPEGC